jgi:hypothetical protein
MVNLADIKIYRMTHIHNIPHIIIHGVTHKISPHANPHYVSIGDVSLINTRNSKQVRISNGNVSSAMGPVITLGNFIPFYFGVRMPMLYVVQHGGNFAEKASPPEEIVYLTCKILDVINSGILFYFSDGHATDGLTNFYDQSKVAKLPSILDWSAIKKQYWGGTDNLETKRKKQAEFLVNSDVAPKYLADFGCYNNTAKEYLLSVGIAEEKIKVVPNAYY